MTARVTQRDRGAAALKARLGAAARAVEVGVIGTDAGRSEDGTVTVSDVATWAEFGLGQPQRSWLRGWIDANGDVLARLMRSEAAAVKAGTRTKREALARLGVVIAGSIQERIANGIAPENAPATIAKKGSSTPLIDKGQFRSSISSRVV